MKFRILNTFYGGKRFRIEEDYVEVGFYLFVYEGGECIRDYLQNSIEDCKAVAFEEFGVPLDIWKEEKAN